MRKGQSFELLYGCFDKTGLAKPKGCTPKSGQTLNILVAGVVPNINPFTPVNNQRALLFVQSKVGIGMYIESNVFLSYGVCMIHFVVSSE